MLSSEIISLALKHREKYETVLDIGSGSGVHSQIFLNAGKKVTSVDYGSSSAYRKGSQEKNKETLIGDYLKINFENQFDLIWASHVLEHQRNPGLFLEKINKDLKEGGFLCITVPPLKHQIVGGHVTLWNPLLLVYNLVLAGFDCSAASIKQYGYNVSVFLKKREIKKLPEISFDKHDFEKLRDFLPSIVHQGCNGNILEFNWGKNVK